MVSIALSPLHALLHHLPVIFFSSSVSFSFFISPSSFFTIATLTEMVKEMKEVATNYSDLTVEERNLLSVAYKNVIGARRASWRIIQSLEVKEEQKSSNSPTRLQLIRDYKASVEKELADICNDILNLVDKKLIPAANAVESQVFYYKM